MMSMEYVDIICTLKKQKKNRLIKQVCKINVLQQRNVKLLGVRRLLNDFS